MCNCKDTVFQDLVLNYNFTLRLKGNETHGGVHIAVNQISGLLEDVSLMHRFS